MDDETIRFIKLALMNPDLAVVLKTLPELALEDCWVVSGAVVQSVWNALTNRGPGEGILDYDVIYFDPDTSWHSEDRVIRRARDLFSAIEKPVQIRNQARVHLWYEEKFAQRVAPLKNACQSLWRYPSRTSAVALGVNGDDCLTCFASFGVGHALNMTIQPNRRSGQVEAYREKARRWRDVWPELEVVNWA